MNGFEESIARLRELAAAGDWRGLHHACANLEGSLAEAMVIFSGVGREALDAMGETSPPDMSRVSPELRRVADALTEREARNAPPGRTEGPEGRQGRVEGLLTLVLFD